MKKITIALITLISLSLVCTSAWACWGDGYWGGTHTSDNNSGTHQDFFNKTKELRSELAAKQKEYNTLIAQEKPNTTRIGELSLEIKGLHDQLIVKARSFDLAGPGAHNNRYSRGCCW